MVRSEPCGTRDLLGFLRQDAEVSRRQELTLGLD